jgi:D-alanyl-D-alanine carboxypeptidase
LNRNNRYNVQYKTSQRKRRRRLRPLPVIILIVIIVFASYKFILPIFSDQLFNELQVFFVHDDFTEDVKIDSDSYYSIVANITYPLPEDFTPSNLVTVSDDIVLEKETATALISMMSAMEKDGITINLESGYRSYDKQKELYDNKIAQLKQEYPQKSPEEIIDIASSSVAVPGTSEHQTGLSIDISVDSLVSANLHQSEAGQWIEENGHKYGFIFRYPDNKQDITGIIHEPWHLRYVGTALAQELKESGLTLEEYFSKQI